MTAEAPVTIADLEALERRLSRPDIERNVRSLQGWRRTLEEDGSFGRIFSGPQWLGGISVIDGSVDGNVFTSQVTISNMFTTAEEPADRWELDPEGMRFYGTVEGVPNTQVVSIESSGDFTFGVPPEAIQFDAATGTLTAPAAIIGTISIAEVSSGVLGGDYATAAAHPKIVLSTSGIVATNSGGTTTFNLQASSGNLFMTGTFRIASSNSASNRIELRETGIELWKNSVREFYLEASGATNTINMLLTGPSVGQYIGLKPDTGFWLGASAFASAPFRVNMAGAVNMTGATITGGTLTSPSISSATITGTTITGQVIRTSASNPRVEMNSAGIFIYNSGGTNTGALGADGSGFMGTGSNFVWNTAGSLTVNGSTLSANSVQSGSIASLNVGKLTSGTLTSQTITIGAGGGIYDGDGSSWTQSGLILKSTAGGSFGDSIKWQDSNGTDRGSIYATTSSASLLLHYPSGGNLQLSSGQALLSANASNSFIVTNSLNGTVGKFHPGFGFNAGNTTYYIEGGGGIISNGIGIGGMLGISSGNTINFIAPGTGGSAGNWSTWDAANPGGAWFNIQIAGNAYRVPFFANG